jgi:hypothetical protein
MPLRRKLILIEAITGLTSAWLLVKLAPYAMLRARLGMPLPMANAPSIGSVAIESDNGAVRDVAWGHQAGRRVFGTRFTCLMYALSARRMLSRRKISSVLVLGVRLSEKAASERLAAHAWLVADGNVIVGREEILGHAPIAAFAWPVRENLRRTGVA